MKKFYYFFVLLLGLTFMTSCEDEVELTDAERFVGTWLYEDPSASEAYETKQIKFVLNKDNKGNLIFLYGDNSRSTNKIKQWWVDEDEGVFELVLESDARLVFDYEFDEDDLLMDLFGDGFMYLLVKQ